MTFPTDPPNPWTTRRTTVLYENPWTRLEQNDVIRPDGKDGTYWVTRFQKRACGIVPFEVRTDEWGRIFLATGLHPGEAAPEGTEDIRSLFVALDDALSAIETGRITDALTVAGLYRVALMWRAGDTALSGMDHS